MMGEILDQPTAATTQGRQGATSAGTSAAGTEPTSGLHRQRHGSAAQAPALQPPHVATSRFVTVALAALVTGLTQTAIRRKIQRGVWLEGRHWRKRDGGIYIDMEAYQRWVEKEPC